MREAILNLLHAINTFSIHSDINGLEKIQKQFNSTYDTNVSLEEFKSLAAAKPQDFAFDTLLPWIDSRLSDGILADSRILYNTPNSILIRDTQTLAERLRSTSTGLIDLSSLTVAMGNQIRANLEISENSKQAFLKIFPHFLAPTLSLNQKETNDKTQAVLDSIKPIYFQIHKGEVIVRKGDIVTREAQLKMQAIFNNTSTNFNFYKTAGTFLLSLILMLGLFMTPSGQKGRILHSKDQLFIAVILILVGMGAGSLALFGQSFSSELSLSLLAYFFPISGIAGLAVLIFAARRYCVIGFLVSFYTYLIFILFCQFHDQYLADFTLTVTPRRCLERYPAFHRLADHRFFFRTHHGIIPYQIPYAHLSACGECNLIHCHSLCPQSDFGNDVRLHHTVPAHGTYEP